MLFIYFYGHKAVTSIYYIYATTTTTILFWNSWSLIRCWVTGLWGSWPRSQREATTCRVKVNCKRWINLSVQLSLPPAAKLKSKGQKQVTSSCWLKVKVATQREPSWKQVHSQWCTLGETASQRGSGQRKKRKVMDYNVLVTHLTQSLTHFPGIKKQVLLNVERWKRSTENRSLSRKVYRNTSISLIRPLLGALGCWNLLLSLLSFSLRFIRAKTQQKCIRCFAQKRNLGKQPLCTLQ